MPPGNRPTSYSLSFGDHDGHVSLNRDQDSEQNSLYGSSPGPSSRPAGSAAQGHASSSRRAGPGGYASPAARVSSPASVSSSITAVARSQPQKRSQPAQSSASPRHVSWASPSTPARPQPGSSHTPASTSRSAGVRAPPTSSSSTGTQQSTKRKENDDVEGGGRPGKRVKVPTTRRLDANALKTDLIEDEHTVINGEDQEELTSVKHEVDEPESPIAASKGKQRAEDVPDEEEGDDRKPIRLLTEFSIFDPKHGNELVSLDELMEDNGRHFEAVGRVAPVFVNEEDAGQEEQDDKLESLQTLRTSAIFHFSIEYEEDEPIYIETQYAWYQLQHPSNSYRSLFYHFYRHHRVAQLAVSWFKDHPDSKNKADVQNALHDTYDELLEEIITKVMVIQAWPLIVSILKSEAYTHLATSSIKGILQDEHAPTQRIVPRRKNVFGLSLRQNMDLYVLRPEAQNKTMVTPFICELADGLFRADLHVVGSRSMYLRPISQAEHSLKLKSLLFQAVAENGPPVFARTDRLIDCYWRRVQVSNIMYEVGDVIVAPAQNWDGREKREIPDWQEINNTPLHHRIADYFWFGKIIFIDQKQKSVHVQWFEHSSRTVLQEVHDPQELFLTETCGDVNLSCLVDKVDVQYFKSRAQRDFACKIANPLRYYYSFLYRQHDGSFIDINESYLTPLIPTPPDNCTVCNHNTAHEASKEPQQIKDGVLFRDVNYHLNDFVLVDSKEKSPLCRIGQILSIKFGSAARDSGQCNIGIAVVGRVNDMLRVYPDQNEIKDERHVFLTTNEVAIIPACNLLARCSVVNYFSMPTDLFSEYQDASPLNLHAKYVCETTRDTDWPRRETLNSRSKKPYICKTCFRDDNNKFKCAEIRKFLQSTSPLRGFDPFGGVGAFGRSMEEAGCLKMTHSIEISPSAAKTLKHNSPHTIVYNQCANLALEDAIKTMDPKRVNYQCHQSITDEPLPPPPRPQDIDCIVAGFPCQPHSKLNMYQKANDRKSHLILNLLSWVDFLKPRFCFFENVRGFLQYVLNGTQATRYTVKNGIQAGGLKFLARALLAMGYQVRFALLQAAHYGTPQTRVRFFLIAAQMGSPLPSFPAPLYHLPPKDSLELKFMHKLTLKPINTRTGTMPFSWITIDDAIGDLQRFDWHDPLEEPEMESPRIDHSTEQTVKIYKSDRTKDTCGPSKVNYAHPEPRTMYQKRVRRGEVRELQHFTRPLKEDTVARVVRIPLLPKANYHSLFDLSVPSRLREWQFSNPNSAIARKGFREGMYGRLGKDEWFRTTVTNVEPTAKQSWVLNPYCKRVYSVRELARSQGFPDSFRFHAETGQKVKTMQRQIGNAVPWPVGVALGRELRDALYRRWLENRQNAELIE